MSEQEIKTLFEQIGKGLNKATLGMLQRKAKLGEYVVVADADGQPVRISAEEALRRLSR